MKVKSKIWLVLLGLLMVTLLVAAACGDDDEEEGAPEVLAPFRIGIMEGITGPAETYGVAGVQAKVMAVDEINAAGGINGRMLEIIVEDSKCNAADGITAYTKLTQVDGVKIILGTSCSGAMLGVAPLAEKDKVIMFSGMTSNPDITFAGDFIFRTMTSDVFIGEDMGNLLWFDGIRTLATISETTDYAEGLRREIARKFEELGGQIVGEERYASDVTDFRSQITKLIGLNADAIYVGSQSEFTGGTVIKQARELGYEGPMYTDVTGSGPVAQEIAGEAIAGVKVINRGLDPNNLVANAFLVNFRERYGYLSVIFEMTSAYETVHIAAECLRQTDDDQDSEGFRDCLYALTFTGALGTYSLDEFGDPVGITNIVLEILPLAQRTEDNLGYKVSAVPAAQ